MSGPSTYIAFQASGEALLSLTVTLVYHLREIAPYAHLMHNIAAHLCQWEILVVVICVLLKDYHVVEGDTTTLGIILILVNTITIIIICYSQFMSITHATLRAAHLKRDNKGSVTELDDFNTSLRNSLVSTPTTHTTCDNSLAYMHLRKETQYQIYT